MGYEAISKAICTLLSSYQYTALLGWMFSIAILLGGLLFHKNFSKFFLALFVSIFFIVLQEIGRVLYFISVNEVITALPATMAFIDGTVFTIGIYIGYTVSSRAKQKVQNGYHTE